MWKRRQILLDEQISELLKTLALDRGGNCSGVVREAIHLYADVESRLDPIEHGFKFEKMMARSEDHIPAGRSVPHREVASLGQIEVATLSVFEKVRGL